MDDFADDKERLKSLFPDFDLIPLGRQSIDEVPDFLSSTWKYREQFTPHDLQILAKYVEWIKANYNRSYLDCPREGYHTLACDLLLSLCMKVPAGKDGHEIASYDHRTKELKSLGYFPAHYLKPVSLQRCDDKDQNIVASITENHGYAAVLAQIKNLALVSVFDVRRATRLMTMSLPRKGFLNYNITGIDINRRHLIQGRYRIAVLISTGIFKTEVRIWDPSTLAERLLQLKNFCVASICGLHRSHFVRFSPDDRFLCVLGNLLFFFTTTCMLVDPVLLEPLHIVCYNVEEPFQKALGPIFPTFTTTGSKFLLPIVTFSLLRDPWFEFVEIPSRTMKSLKELCRRSILSLVIDVSKLNRLPLPKDSISYLTAALPFIKCDEKSKKKSCNLM